MPLVGYWETNEDCCRVAGGASTLGSVFGGNEAEGGIGLVGVVMLHKLLDIEDVSSHLDEVRSQPSVSITV